MQPRRNYLVCSLLLLFCSPHPMFWLSYLCQDLPGKKVTGPCCLLSWPCLWVLLGAGMCKLAHSCLSWWSGDPCTVCPDSQLLRKHTEISPQAKVGLCAHNTVEHYFFQVGIFALTPAMIVGIFSLDYGSRLPPQRVLVFIFFQTCIDFLSSCSAWWVMKVFHRAPIALRQPYCFLVLLVRGSA